MSSQPNAALNYQSPADGAAERPSPWAPLRVELFRSLWIATSIAQIGIWMREAAGPWLMKLMTDGLPTQPSMVAKVTMYSNLPIFLFSVFAGALADVLDRRRLLIFTHTWLLAVSVLLGLLTLTHAISPGVLLAVTFFLGLGTAATGPALQAVLPELVPRKDFALAINLNSVALNVARAVGPALFIVIVAMPGLQGHRGVGTAFLLSGISFAAAVYVLKTWDRPHQRAALHGESVWDGIRAGFVYVIHSPANRAILIRVAAFIIPALVLWAQVPIIATQQLGFQKEAAEKVSALLFAFVGTGAVVGVLLMPRLHARYNIDPVVNVCIACFAAGLMVMSQIHTLWLAAPVMVFLGVNWVIIPTNFNTATQKSVPLWVKGRAISFYLTVLFGSFTVGSRLWGAVTTNSSIGTSLFLAGLSMALLLALAHWFPLTLNEGHDLSPAYAPGSTPAGPDIPPPLDPALGWTGPVNVSVEYWVPVERMSEFLTAMRPVARQRQRSGARRWALRWKSTEAPTSDVAYAIYVEQFRFHSATEYGRQLSRMTKEDAELHRSARSFHIGESVPSYRAQPVRDAAAGAGTVSMGPVNGGWLANQFWHALERTAEEAENVVVRLSR